MTRRYGTTRSSGRARGLGGGGSGERAFVRAETPGGGESVWRRVCARWGYPLLIVVCGLVAYSSSFAGTYVLDDDKHILNNARIRAILPLSETLSGRRPLVNLTLAVNYALAEVEGGRPDPWGFHAVNVAIHLLAGLTLHGIVGRTVWRSGFAQRLGVTPSGIGLAVALIWVVHPLQTQSVTYLIQRGESLMGLFYLLTLYCAIRAAHAREGIRARRWSLAAVVACALGMGSKAVMITAPVMVVLYDWVFLRGIGRQWRRRLPLYLGLMMTWAVPVVLGVVRGVLSRSRPGATVGLSVAGVTPLEYLLTQIEAVTYYLRLAVLPYPLCLDHAWPIVDLDGGVDGWRVLRLVLCGLVLMPVLAVTVWGVVRRTWFGFVGAWFFVILAPTSSVIPVRDAVFEHRMYLPLAAVVAAGVVAAVALIGRVSRRARQGVSEGPASPTRHGREARRRWNVGVSLLAMVTAVLGGATYARNFDYHDELGMWRDVLSKAPHNARAYLGLGTALYNRRDYEASLRAFERAVDLRPSYADAHYNVGNSLTQLGRYEEAVMAYRRAIRTRPDDPRYHYNLGNTLKRMEAYEAAANAFQATIRFDPNHVSAHINLGNTLQRMEQYDEAIEHYLTAVRINPTHANAYYNLGNAYWSRGDIPEALAALKAAVTYDPANEKARRNLQLLQEELERP